MILPQSNNSNNKELGSDRSRDVENISNDLKSLKQSGAAMAQHLKVDAQDLTKSVQHEAKNTVHNMKVYADDKMKWIEQSVTEKPVQSVAIAFAVGAILSLFMGRR